MPSFRKLQRQNEALPRVFDQYENTDHITARPLGEPYGDYYVIQNPPAAPLSQEDLDAVYSLPFVRDFHPIYEKSGGVPAVTEVKYSLTSNRGCFGGCSFCAISFHQGRVVQARSKASLVQEAQIVINDPGFKGYIHDVGGPTANFQGPACEKQTTTGVCKHRKCLVPDPCENLIVDHESYLQILRRLRKLPKVKKVFIRSGIRYDYLVYDTNGEFFRELCAHHISGQLKVAPEHVSPIVLAYMGKPHQAVYDQFVKKYHAHNEELGKKQYLVPYFMSSHPGSDLTAAVELAEYIRDTRQMPEQVQDFYPTPGTLSTCMYYTEVDPRTMQRVYVAKDPHEKAMQRALIHYNRPQNHGLVVEALRRAQRTDLIGYGSKCLVPPVLRRTKRQRRVQDEQHMILYEDNHLLVVVAA